MSKRALAALLLTLSAGLVTAGCMASVWVPIGPPDALVDVHGVIPAPGYVWIDGYWEWHNRWAWRNGYWAKPPRARATWEPGRWERGNRGWRWHEGHWR